MTHEIAKLQAVERCVLYKTSDATPRPAPAQVPKPVHGRHRHHLCSLPPEIFEPGSAPKPYNAFAAARGKGCRRRSKGDERHPPTLGRKTRGPRPPSPGWKGTGEAHGHDAWCDGAARTANNARNEPCSVRHLAVRAPSCGSHAPRPRRLVDSRTAGRETCHMLDLLTAPQTLAALVAIAGATVFFVAWRCWRD
jgi:hypothetical protein